ncbi:hypothetical protein BKA62DRAFT_754853 [Auriculariales sp. MPI-PUGE-AT-0066]|nr:hypothetical protein BKA62DRAFT_754853 [Auriculariales sp. MPI-PUGE-AT-0066]
MARGHKQSAHTPVPNGTQRPSPQVQPHHNGAMLQQQVQQQQQQQQATAAATAVVEDSLGGGKFDTRLTPGQRYFYNLKAIRRHDPSVLYVFHHFTYLHIYKKVVPGPDGDPWHKEDVEGTMYILRRKQEPHHWLLVVNRLGNRNFYRPIDGHDAVLDTVQLIQWRCTRHNNEVWAFWSDTPAELAEFRIVLEAVVEAEKNGQAYVPDLGLSSSQVWAQDEAMYAARQRLLHGIIDDEPPLPNIDSAPLSSSSSSLALASSLLSSAHGPSVTPSRARARAAVPFQEPEDDDVLHLPVATPAQVTAVDALFAKFVGPSSPMPDQRTPVKSTKQTKRAREMLDQLFAPTPPPPPPIGMDSAADVQSPKPQVLNNDVLHMLLGLPTTPHEEPAVNRFRPPPAVDDDEEEVLLSSHSHTPMAVAKPTPHPKAVAVARAQAAAAATAAATMPSGIVAPVSNTVVQAAGPHVIDREAVIDAAVDLLSRRKDPVLSAVQPPSLIDKNDFGRRLVELIHTPDFSLQFLNCPIAPNPSAEFPTLSLSVLQSSSSFLGLPPHPLDVLLLASLFHTGIGTGDSSTSLLPALRSKSTRPG